MTMTANLPTRVTPKRRKDGLIGLWGRIIHRDRGAYERWLEERDLTAITRCLLRLNERQLNRLGFSHATLGLDVEDLAERAKHEAQIGVDVLRIVEQSAPMEADDNAKRPPRDHQAIAAE